MVGLTFTVIVGAVPLNGVPSDKFPEIVPEPVTATDNVALPPLQIDCVPLITPVGRGFTETVALPVLSVAMDVQVPLVNVAIV